SSLVTLGLGDGPHTGAVSLRITESSVVVFQDTTTLTINNVGSTASINTIPAGIVATVPASFTFGATDPSATDTALGFTYLINWGDGSLVQTVTGGTSVVVPHTYPVGGPFVLTVTATD